MEEPPRIEKVTASKGISLSDTATILQSFIDTLDNNHTSQSSQQDQTDPPPNNNPNTPTNGTPNKWNTPRKTRQEIEEESILKQFDLLSKQMNSGLVSDDTYERLKLIRDSIAGEACGKPLLPSQTKIKSVDNDYTNRAHDTYNENGNTQDNQEETMDEAQQFINDLNKAEQELTRQQDEVEMARKEAKRELIRQEEEVEMARKEAKKAKKEKKAAKKAKKEAKREKREKRKVERESGDGHDNGGDLKRSRVEDIS